MAPACGRFRGDLRLDIQAAAEAHLLQIHIPSPASVPRRAELNPTLAVERCPQETDSLTIMAGGLGVVVEPELQWRAEY